MATITNIFFKWEPGQKHFYKWAPGYAINVGIITASAMNTVCMAYSLWGSKSENSFFFNFNSHGQL